MSDSRAVIPPPTSTFASFQAQQARIVMEGRLNKLKGRGLGKSWVPQHFVLKADAFYYTPNKIFSHKQKKISLVKARIGTAQHYTKKDNAFGIMDARKRALHIMSAESESLMHEWIRALIAVRTALEGRVRDAKPNPTLALNPRFPDIPSLPPLRKDNDQDEADAAYSPSAARAQASATYLAHLTDESDSDGPDAGDDSRSRAPDSMPAAAAAAAGLRSTAGRLPTRRADESGVNAARALPAPSLVSSRSARPTAADPLGLAERQDEPRRVRETDADRQTDRDRDRDRDRQTDRQRQREGRARKKQEPSPARSSVISPARALTATPRHVAEADAAVTTVARGVLLPVHPLRPSPSASLPGEPQLASAFSREMVRSAVIPSLSAAPLVCCYMCMRKVSLWQ